jgi:hypothetical protein
VNLRELIDAFRDDTGDTELPYRVSDSKAIRFANRAQVEAARRARLLVDSSDETICRISYSAGDPIVSIDYRIISIRRAVIEGSSSVLAKRVMNQMDDEFPGWYSSESRSTPFILVVDYGAFEARLYPTPKSDGTLHLTVTREPKKPMSSDGDKPEIPARCHEGLIEGMKMYAYQSEDPDLSDEKLAAMAAAAFELEFGPAISSTNERYEFEHYHDIGER